MAQPGDFPPLRPLPHLLSPLRPWRPPPHHLDLRPPLAPHPAAQVERPGELRPGERGQVKGPGGQPGVVSREQRKERGVIGREL